MDGPDVRLIDFDRVRASDPESDLGSFAAVEDIADRRRADAGPAARPGPLIDGYTARPAGTVHP